MDPESTTASEPPSTVVLTALPPEEIHWTPLTSSALVTIAPDSTYSVPARNTTLLTVALGSGFLSRQVWGWFSDHAGGRMTLAVGSACQAGALAAFLLTRDEIGLFAVSAVFGLGFAGLVPAYVLVLREFFPVSEASRSAVGDSRCSEKWLNAVRNSTR